MPPANFAFVWSILLVLPSCAKKPSDATQTTETPSTTETPPKAEEEKTNPPVTPPGTIALPNDGSTIEGLNLAIPAVEPPVTAATPASFGGPGTVAITTALTDGFGLVDTAIEFDNDGTAAGQDCFQGGQYDNVCAAFTPGSEAKIACQFVVDVKCRMFSPSPTHIKSILESLDERTAEFASRAEGKRVPCADSTDPNFKLVELDTNFTNIGNNRAGSPQSIDLGFTYALSCIEDLGTSPSGGESFVGFGQKAAADGRIVTYVREGNSRGGGSVAAVDENGNVDFYKSLPEDKDATYASLQQSAGLIHIKVDAATGNMEMSFTGKDLGPGCGVVMKTDGTYFYAKANVNSNLRCTAAEQADAIGIAATGPNFDPTFVDKEFCIKVDQAASMTLVDLQTCTARNLSSSALSIVHLKRELLEAPHAAKIFALKPSGVAAYSFEDVPKASPAEGEETSPTQTPAATPVQYTCSQTHEKSFSKNCSTLFYAESLEAATQRCRATEAAGGEGCCASSKVFTNAYGPVASFTVKPADAAGTSYVCE